MSTPTNIVEGSVRRSDKHYLRYLETALGSACEALMIRIDEGIEARRIALKADR